MKPNAARLHVTFWGTRGSVPTPGDTTEKYGGNTACVSVRYRNTVLILDAGTGIRGLGLDLLQSNARRKSGLNLHLLLSHTHWDHIQGLPFFGPAYRRETRLRIYGSPKKEKLLSGILDGQMDVNYFPVAMKSLAASISIIELTDRILEIGPFRVEWQEQIAHPGGSVRYRISAGGRVVVYATDVELPKVFGPESGAGDPALAKEYAGFVRNADLLIADAQYTADEYRNTAGWGHSPIPLVLDVSHSAGVRQLAMFHHDPQHSDAFWIRSAPATPRPMPRVQSP